MPEAECTRRANNRKIDPTTQIVYHMETNPPEDNKILERLTDYTDEAGESRRMEKINAGFYETIPAIKNWLTRFGLNSADGSVCEVQLDMAICLESKTEVIPAAEGEENAEVQHKTTDPWKDK